MPYLCISYQYYEAGTIIISILQTHRKGKGQTASKQHSQDFKLGSQATEYILFSSASVIFIVPPGKQLLVACSAPYLHAGPLLTIVQALSGITELQQGDEWRLRLPVLAQLAWAACAQRKGSFSNSHAKPSILRDPTVGMSS